MMATLNLSLAWSVAVPVEILGAHLQAYVQLLPTINTIRLCNRFGKGPKAAITKLPIEIITEIESYVTEAEREKQRENWAKDLACLQGLCKPSDHMSESEQVGLWLDIFYHPGECDECSECGDECEDMDECFCRYRQREMTSLRESQQRSLDEILQDEMRDEGPEDSGWWIEHESRCERWHAKTGRPAQTQDRGLLSTYSGLLKRHFGLEMWVTHTQPKERLQEYQFSTVEVFASTTAYLALSHAKTHAKFDRGYSEARVYSDGMPYLATQSGGGVDVSTPSELSAADIFRFSRAVKVLGLTPEGHSGSEKIAGSPTGFEKSTSQRPGEPRPRPDDRGAMEDGAMGEETSKQPKNNHTPQRWTPQLRMLYSQAVDDAY